MVPLDLESPTQDLLPWLAVSTQQLCSLFVSRWLFWSYTYVRWSFDFEINLIGHFTGPAAPRLPFHPQVHCQRNCSHFCYRKGGALDILIAVSVVMLWNIIWCIKRWPAHSCPLKDPLQPREIGYRWFAAEFSLDVSVTPGIHSYTYSGPCSWELLRRVPCGHFQPWRWYLMKGNRIDKWKSVQKNNDLRWCGNIT